MDNVIFLLYDMCRLCLDRPGEHNIFESDELISDIVMYTGILHVSRTDKLPQSICSTCLYRIETAKDLRTYTERNDQHLKSLLTNGSHSADKIARPKMPLISITPGEKLVISRPKVPINTITPGEELVTSSGKKEATRSVVNKKKDNDIIDTEAPSQSSTRSEERPQTKRPKISVRSLSDINTSLYVTSSSEKDEKSQKMKPRTEPLSSSNNDEHKCDICQKTYATSKKLYLHRRSHSKNLFCPLDACGKNFATKGDLQKHIRSHTGEKPYHCDLCDKSFAQNVTLKAHKDSVHIEKHN